MVRLTPVSGRILHQPQQHSSSVLLRVFPARWRQRKVIFRWNVIALILLGGKVDFFCARASMLYFIYFCARRLPPPLFLGSPFHNEPDGFSMTLSEWNGTLAPAVFWSFWTRSRQIPLSKHSTRAGDCNLCAGVCVWNAAPNVNIPVPVPVAVSTAWTLCRRSKSTCLLCLIASRPSASSDEAV